MFNALVTALVLKFFILDLTPITLDAILLPCVLLGVIGLCFSLFVRGSLYRISASGAGLFACLSLLCFQQVGLFAGSETGEVIRSLFNNNGPNPIALLGALLLASSIAVTVGWFLANLIILCCNILKGFIRFIPEHFIRNAVAHGYKAARAEHNNAKLHTINSLHEWLCNLRRSPKCFYPKKARMGKRQFSHHNMMMGAEK